MKRYRIISELGKGATGVVFRAIRSKDGSTVALKKLNLPGHLDAHEEEEFVRRFKSEAKAAESLKHPGIVGALDCGLDEGTLYIAYELIEGVTIEEAIKSGRNFSPEEVTDFVMQIAEAMEYAHGEGVVHRDLSPGNIFITNDGKARITDFGVAGFTTKATLTPGDESIVGTPGYMAPEQITGGEVDPRSDIFSLGCIAYELLAGNPPFTGQNLAQIIHRVINEQPVPIRQLNPKVPLVLEEVIFRMLAKKPEYRYQSMREVQSASERILEEIPRAGKAGKIETFGHAPILVAIAGPYEGKQFNLLPTVTTIGRIVGDVLLSGDEKVAGQHAWITKEKTGWVLYDADTESGTLLNGESIEREEILAGDRIQMGDTVLEFRGAGGHVGAFKETAEAVDILGPKKVKKVGAESRRVGWPLIVMLAVPGIIVIAALIVFGFVIPRQYMTKLNEATDTRWSGAFRTIDATAVGSPGWLMDARDVLADWGGSSLDPAEFLAPSWMPGSGRINNEVLFRFDLFNVAEEFLVTVTTVTDPDTPADPIHNSVGEIERAVDTLDVPSGVSRLWKERKNQLLGVVRKWMVASTSGTAITLQSTGFASEREQARDALLTGWYIYLDSGNSMELLDDAFTNFDSAIKLMNSVIESRPNDKDAIAIRGLAYFLAARILRDAGFSLGPDRFQRALSYLANAEKDISLINGADWDRAIPGDFTSEFNSFASVAPKFRALRSQLESLVQ